MTERQRIRKGIGTAAMRDIKPSKPRADTAAARCNSSRQLHLVSLPQTPRGEKQGRTYSFTTKYGSVLDAMVPVSLIPCLTRLAPCLARFPWSICVCFWLREPLTHSPTHSLLLYLCVWPKQKKIFVCTPGQMDNIVHFRNRQSEHVVVVVLPRSSRSPASFFFPPLAVVPPSPLSPPLFSPSNKARCGS